LAHRVLLVVDVRAYRDGLRCWLDEAEDIRVVGAVASGQPALEAVGELRPEVVLLELATLDRLSMVEQIVARSRGTKVVALGVPETETHVVACAEAGILGYVPAEAPVQDVVGTVRSAARGEALCSPRIAGALFRRLAATGHQRRSSSVHPILTQREHEILQLIDQGRSNKEIAYQLCIEVATVKNHVHNILGKLEVHRRAEAAACMRRMDGGEGDLHPRIQEAAAGATHRA
jgi:two-component system, NarL family, nitrate/nitrite response regulator NarL